MITEERINELLKEINEVLALTNWSVKPTSENVNKLSKVYKKVFNKPLLITCSTCIIEAYYELKEITNQTLIKMSEKKESAFQIEEGKLITLHGMSDDLTAVNVTDEKAVEFLAHEPRLIKHFAKFPEDWEKRVAKYKASKVKKSTAPVEKAVSTPAEAPANESAPAKTAKASKAKK